LRDRFQWGSSELWRDRTISYTSVWLLLYSLVDSPHLHAGELLTALSNAQQGSRINLPEHTAIAIGSSRQAEQAHRLVQQFLLDPLVP
jgi:hypothetical protein